jgi:hypothetical protein
MGAQAAIIRALGAIGDEAASDFLSEIYFQDPASWRGRAALGALEAIGGPGAEQALRVGRAVSDVKTSDAEQRAKGIAELRLLGQAGTHALIAEIEKWTALKHHPDLSMAEALEEDRENREIIQRLSDALSAVRETPESSPQA